MEWDCSEPSLLQRQINYMIFFKNCKNKKKIVKIKKLKKK